MLDTSIVDGKTLITVKSGGQMATVFQSQFPFEERPDNVTGATGPYLVRIPFEIWNIADPDNQTQSRPRGFPKNGRLLFPVTLSS